MVEGLLSLMQMAKTSAALARHAEAGLAYIPILTHPTMAGVMASFATLGDLIVAEPEALIGFAGPRVIKETTQQDLPEGFQRAEFLQDHGLIDMVIPRNEMRERMISLLAYLCDAFMNAVERLFRRTADGIKPSLEVMEALVQTLDHPERSCALVHVAGTNGKGLVCAMIESVLRASGLKTGLYTSPHLLSFQERFRVNGVSISDKN